MRMISKIKIIIYFGNKINIQDIDHGGFIIRVNHSKHRLFLSDFVLNGVNQHGIN
jgi:hypothetical protein